MAIRYVRAATLSIISVLALILVGLSLLYWQLNSGPVELGFLNKRIEEALNQQLPGTAAKIGKTILELDPDSGAPVLRFVNISLLDESGALIARAPKAGLELDLSGILTGNIRPAAFDIYGARLNALRTIDGTFELGIADAAPIEDSVINFDDTATTPENSTKGDFNTESPPADNRSPARRLMSYLRDSPLAGLQEVHVRQAQVRFEDETNDARWFAPDADVIIRRTPDGLRMDADALISSSGSPWRAKASATYSSATRLVNVSGTIEDVIPVDVASKIYALSQFAKIQSPLSGSVNFELDEQGTVRSATGKLTAGQGAIDLPSYVANPLTIDSGSFQFAYERGAGVINLSNSTIIVNGAQVPLTGSFKPENGPDGRLAAIIIKLDSGNAASQDKSAAPRLIDRVSFAGRAATGEQRLDIDDLVVMDGQTGVRLRGTISGGDLSAGIQLAGRLRDVDADLLKQLWPPILTPNTRTWIQKYVSAGRVSEGTFQINLPPGELSSALRDKAFKPGSVALSIKLAGVTSGYFKSMSPLRAAHGFAELKDNEFHLTIEGGNAEFGGEHVNVSHGTFDATDLLQPETKGGVKFDLAGTTAGLKGFLAEPDLAALKVNAGELPPLTGNVAASLSLDFPLIKDVPKERVKFGASIILSDAGLQNVAPGIDLTGANFKIVASETAITATGPALLNGVPSQIEWQRTRPAGEVRTTVETTLDTKTQAKLGIDLGEFAKGDVPLKIIASGAISDGAEVEADLSGLSMKVDALAWQRKPTKGTTLKVALKPSENGRVLDNLRISGPGLSIKGDIALSQSNKLRVANLTEVVLGDDYSFSVRLEPGDSGTRIAVKGNTFDARPYIRSIVSPVRGGEGKAQVSGPAYTIEAEIDRVYANRGEIIQNVRATLTTGQSTVQNATIKGSFVSGLPINLQLSPAPEGRKLRVTTADGGAALRAANFYSKIAGGQLDFEALMSNAPGSPIRDGLLRIRNFAVRNEAALAELDRRGKPKKSGPRRDGLSFKRLDLPFTTDPKFVRLCKVSLRGPDLGATASGVIRKSDGAIDISGTFIPAYGLNSFLGEFPLIGDILTGGNKEGVLGITYAMGGTIAKPRYQMNPLSFLAPGILRKLFEYEKTGCGNRAPEQQSLRENQVDEPSPY